MTRWHVPLMAGVVLLAVAPQAHAAVHISVGDLYLQPGETGFVDVMISSDTGTDLLDTFGVEFRITTGGSTRLEFVDPPTDPQLGDPNYVLAGDSLFLLFPPAGAVLSFFELNDTYIGGDGTISMAGVLVPTTETLLASLEVTAATASAPGVGDTFTISLEPGPFTYFYDPVFTPIDFSSSSGTVSVIPEAASLIIWSLLTTCGVVTVVCRRRRHAT